MSFLRDMGASLRAMARRPGTLALAVLTLALGIGASTAIFSVIYAVLLRPLALPDADRLVMAWDSNPRADLPKSPVAALNYRDWLEGSRGVFENLAAAQESRVTITGAAEPVIVTEALVSGNFFATAGVPPLLGGTFGLEQDRPGAARVVVLEYGLWQRLFGGDSSVLGRTLDVDGKPHVVLGVMPKGFGLPHGIGAWAPLALDFASATRSAHELTVVGRLRPGISVEQAQSALSHIAARLSAEFPKSNKDWGVRVASLRDSLVGDARPALIVLLVAVAFVLLIGCANVANLLLSQVVEREREIAIRTAMGATKGVLVRQMLAESLTLFLLGGAAGLVLAAWGTRLLVGLDPDAIPRAEEIGFDLQVLCFSLALSLVTGLLVGLVPALHARAGQPNLALKEGGLGLAGGSRGRGLRNALIALEVTVALVLLVGATLLIESFSHLHAVDPGFSAQGVLMAGISLPPARYPDPKVVLFFQDALRRIESLPGVQRAAAVFPPPFDAHNLLLVFAVEGRPNPPPEERATARVRIVSPGYFAALHVPILAGRDFIPADDQRAPQVVIVNRQLARQVWPGEDPVGKRIKFGGPWSTVIGVAGDTRSRALSKEPGLEAYWPLYQLPFPGATLLARTERDPAALTAPLRSLIGSLDRGVPVERIQAMAAVVADSLAQSRFKSALLGLFAGLALVLAAVGIYGVISYAVARRTHEIGVRMALGADRGQVHWMVVGRGMVPVLVGLAVGLVAARLAVRLLADQVYGVQPDDPLTFIAAPLFLAAVAWLAHYLGARHATRIEPSEALRYE